MKTLPLNDVLYSYIVDHCPLPSQVLDDLRRETADMEQAGMQISADQGSFLYFLTKLVSATRVLEIGCFTGYSSICMAAGLPSEGKLTTLDVSRDFTDVAQRYWQRAGVDSKIDLQLGPALASLQDLKGKGEVFDLMFIDADKENMAEYYELGLTLLRSGGLLIADNVLWSGAVIDRSNETTSTLAIRAFNEKVRNDERVDRVMLHIADGLYLARKR